jgi:hypothetical protein
MAGHSASKMRVNAYVPVTSIVWGRWDKPGDDGSCVN